MKNLFRTSTIVEVENTNICNKKWRIAIGFVIIVLFCMCLAAYQPEIEINRALRDQYKNLKEIDFEQYLPKNMQPKHIPFIVPNIRLVEE